MTGEMFVFKLSCWIFDFCLGINTLSIDLSMKSHYQGVGDLQVSAFLAFCYPTSELLPESVSFLSCSELISLICCSFTVTEHCWPNTKQ